MFASESQGGPNISLITIVCSWIFLFLALIGVIIVFWFRRIRKMGLDLGDYLIILALATTTALVAQTTWAIVDEGQDQHQAELSNKKVTVVVRVGLSGLGFFYILTSQAVPSGKSDSMGPGEYICSNERHFVHRNNLSNTSSEMDHTIGAGFDYTLRISCHP